MSRTVKSTSLHHRKCLA
ncbi:hypothetical protein E2C01_028905 [Portunus trituberculatus]|uniref:Uncharacterized protein n=1 Tax=Portunus trituberculatus TaxID=210409 RepID=A0A5B7ELX3_PORTR|nr:hypothetical protein [Portunus trituberculatus]